jgi:hypothetical protein
VTKSTGNILHPTFFYAKKNILSMELETIKYPTTEKSNNKKLANINCQHGKTKMKAEAARRKTKSKERNKQKEHLLTNLANVK